MNASAWPTKRGARIARRIAVFAFGLLAGSLLILALVIDPTWRSISAIGYMEMFDGIVQHSEVYMPALVLTIVVSAIAAMVLERPRSGVDWLLAAAPLIGVAFVFGITLSVHVPINQWVAALDAPPEAAALARRQEQWTLGQYARTAVAVVTYAIIILR